MEFPTELVLSIPGVTQVTYWYKGLANGPETRQFKIKGHMDGTGSTAKLYLAMDGDVSDGPKDLTVKWMVNYKWDKGTYPTYSPFLAGPGDASTSGYVKTYEQESSSSEGGEGKGTKQASAKPVTVQKSDYVPTPFATFHEQGEHRDGKKPWREYEYFWYAHKITEPAPSQKQ
jgi:hypothetical protein